MTHSIRTWSPWRHYLPDGKTELLLTLTDNDCLVLSVLCFGVVILFVQAQLWLLIKNVIAASSLDAPSLMGVEETAGRQDAGFQVVETSPGKFLGRLVTAPPFCPSRR
jgi:hypothetical protein